MRAVHGAVRLHHRRRGLFPRQRHRGGVARRAAAGPRAQGPAPQARPLSERGPGDDVPDPARRGLRHRRRRGDRPRPRPLRALHRRPRLARRQLDLGAHLRRRHRGGAARRLPGRHRPGDPAHHRQDQGIDPGRDGRLRLRPGRGRRHRRRHREPALPGGHPPVRQRDRAAAQPVHPPDPGALDPDRGRAEDQADPALGQGTAEPRHPAADPALPLRPADPGQRAAQDRPLLQRAAGKRDPGARRRHHLRRAAPVPRRRARRGGAPPLQPLGLGQAGPRPVGADRRRDPPAGRRGHGRGGRQVHEPPRQLQIAA